jgi:hypothetical protein
MRRRRIYESAAGWLGAFEHIHPGQPLLNLVVMVEPLLTQHTVSRVIGQSRLRRLVRAGWLKPAEHNVHSVLFSPRDVHAALTRLERQVCPPDRIEVARVRASEVRNGHPRVRKGRPQRPGIDAIELDFSTVQLSSDVQAHLDDDEADNDDDSDLTI